MPWWSWIWAGAVTLLTAGDAADEWNTGFPLRALLDAATGLWSLLSIRAHFSRSTADMFRRAMLPVSVLAMAWLLSTCVVDARTSTPDPAFSPLTNAVGLVIALTIVIVVVGSPLVLGVRRSLEYWAPSRHPTPNQSSGTRQFWICPRCRRHVPSRLPACRCGFSRQEGSGIQFAQSTTGEQAQQGNTGNLYVKAKVWDKPCPRCNQPSSVDVYLLAPIWRVGAMLVMLAVLAIIFLLRSPYRRIVVTLVPLLSILRRKVSSRAACRHCGSRLNKTLLGGWA